METPAPRKSWRRHKVLGTFVRFVATLGPLTASVSVGVAGHALVPVADAAVVSAGRWVLILVISLGAMVAMDSATRKFLPLAALLQLSLSFPDEMPSRFNLAARQGSKRRMARLTADARRYGLSEEPAVAAEQLVLLAGAIGDHDRRTRGHSERVRLYAELIGRELGLTPAERDKLQWAALIHDVGKVTVPSDILNKKGRPDQREWQILQGHPMSGEELVGAAEAWLGEWVHAVGGHHERWDGSGYPRGLRGEEIPRAAAVVAVADAFEVMTAVRSYKTAMTLEEARRELTRCAGAHFSPSVVRALLNVSVRELRKSMGIVAALAHVPFFGRVTSAAAYAPDSVSAAMGFTGTTATAGAGAVAFTAAMAVTGPMASAQAPQPPVPAAAGLPATSAEAAALAEAATAAEAASVEVAAAEAAVAAEATPVEVPMLAAATIDGEGATFAAPAPAPEAAPAPAPAAAPASFGPAPAPAPARSASASREPVAPAPQPASAPQAAPQAAPAAVSTPVAEPEASVPVTTPEAAPGEDPSPDPAKGDKTNNGRASRDGETGRPDSPGNGNGNGNGNSGENGNGGGNAGGNGNGGGNAGGNGNGGQQQPEMPTVTDPGTVPTVPTGNGNGNGGQNGNGGENGKGGGNGGGNGNRA